MKSIQPFIDLGFHTVPLKGKLERLEDGTKTTPIYRKNWKTHYQTNFNEEASALGGTLTGSISNIIAIDCDDQVTYDLFRTLDLNNAFHFVSKGKPKGGGTIIYKYPEGTTLESFSIQSDLMHLDFYSDNGFVYLPTEANRSKHVWLDEELPALCTLPKTVETLLLSLQYQYTLSKGQVKESSTAIVIRANYLAPQIELMVSQKKFIPSLFRIITPKDFRDLPQYIKHGYLHPEEVPEGRGSEYLTKVSAIFGADPSVSHELYLSAMMFINNMWSFPVQNKRFESTILEPMVNGRSSIDGDPIWTYDEHWKEHGLAFSTKLGDAVEVFFDDIRASYYMINYTKDMVKMFYKEGDLFSYIEPIAIALPPRKELKAMCPVVRTTQEPGLPFGFFNTDAYNREFNTFRQTPALAILSNPESYVDMYSRPTTIINFMETLIPDNYMRNYVLGFLKRKLTSFKYSPVILYMLGAHGSGKDTFVNIVAAIMGESSLARPSAKEFLEQYNGWMIDKYFVQLDEYGNQLHKLCDKQEALGKIKMYTGKPSVQIREMRSDGFNYKHMATFIMSANTNPLMLEDGDRRVALIETPTVLKTADWVGVAGGMTTVIEKIETEINDFCYYLATEVNALSWDDYAAPPETDGKRDIIASKLPAAQRLGYYFRHSMFEQLEELLEEANCLRVLDHASESRIYDEDLFQLYTYMTEGRGSKKGLSKVLREYEYEKVPTTKDGVKAYYYHIKSLAHYKPTHSPFEEQDFVEVDLDQR